jgi:chemotaxis signal transduction protein
MEGTEIERMTEGSTRAARGLECLIGAARLGIPAESVKQIIEYEVMSPVPLARPGFAGLGVFDAKVLVSITLAAPEPRGAPEPGRRSTKGVLLNVPQSSIDWALEVSGIVGFLEADLRTAAPRPDPAPGAGASWIGEATTADGRTIGWIDVAALLGDFLPFPPDGPGPRG